MRHDPTPGGLSTKHRRAAPARAAGVQRDTLHRWLKQPAVLAAVREAESRAVDELSRSLVRLGQAATTTLAATMTDPAAPNPMGVRAAGGSRSGK